MPACPHRGRLCKWLLPPLLGLALASMGHRTFAAPTPVPAPNRAIAPEAPPPIIFSPQITVPPALPPPVTFSPQIMAQVPEPNPLKTWLPVGVAIFSAAVAAFSAWLARRSQNFAIDKDCAAVVRDHRARQAEAGLLAYENNVARPVGAVLDLVERMVNDVSKIRPVAAADVDRKLKDLGLSVMADQANSERLCREADGALPKSISSPEATPSPKKTEPPSFAKMFVRRGMDTLFLEAITEALKGPPGGKFEQLLKQVQELKVELRGHLEKKRRDEAIRWIRDITEDPLYDRIKHYLDPTELPPQPHAPRSGHSNRCFFRRPRPGMQPAAGRRDPHRE